MSKGKQKKLKFSRPGHVSAGESELEDLRSEDEELVIANKRVSLKSLFEELRRFRRDVTAEFREFREELKRTNSRVDQAENRILETEDRIKVLEDSVLDLRKRQAAIEAKLTDQEGKQRRDNIRIHGLIEGTENGFNSMAECVESLLREKLDIPQTTDLKIEKAHRSLAARPAAEAPPRSVLVRFSNFKIKQEVVRLAWQKKGFMHQERKVYVEHDYAPEVLKKRREYNDAKKVLREKKLRFQTPFPAKLRVFYGDETCLYNSAEEATADMAKRGLPVTVFKPAADPSEKIKAQTWTTQRPSKSTDQQRETQHQSVADKLSVFRLE